MTRSGEVSSQDQQPHGFQPKIIGGDIGNPRIDQENPHLVPFEYCIARVLRLGARFRAEAERLYHVIGCSIIQASKKLVHNGLSGGVRCLF